MKRVLSSILVASGVLLGSTLASASYAADAAAAKPDAKKGEQLFANGDAARGILACASCHGAAGNSTIPANPNLAAQPHEYLAKQLHDFRSADGTAVPARRGAGGANTVMTAFAAALTPEDIQNVALYLSHQKLDSEKAATASNEATMLRGQKIWRGGIAERNVPACAACHSANGAGLPGEFPRLSGQFPAYIAEQLKLFRSGERANNAMMHDIADRMSDSDIAAVADYAAGLR
ncbi:c-type cytochrome [Eoetvoesiella caeni]|uniref:Cytochrome c553 n=1 Tax=Eoetvoesiella caeni TaxID=645616 RepID=A0A366HIA2_9BURK|nr:c-type cytochrome [Eoetvoesiella caeni]MCI2807952.1 c-type cytochrome [Eoetvoesiella caeni]NYT54045.1 c-type cytochrome [Eoetvoesiella caeni]RBP41871.1 cytochrome c553 [Eoetvoesiella caeni]